MKTTVIAILMLGFFKLCLSMILITNENNKIPERRLDITQPATAFVQRIKKLRNSVNDIKKEFKNISLTTASEMDEILGTLKQQVPNDITIWQLNNHDWELKNQDDS